MIRLLEKYREASAKEMTMAEWWERARPLVGSAMRHLLAVLVIVFFAFPVYWIVSVSLKTSMDAWSFPPKWVWVPTLENYRALFQTHPFARYYMNSFIVVLGSLVIGAPLGTLAAYGLARFEFPLKDNLAFWVLSQLMLPPIAVAIPFYLMLNKLKLLHTYLGLILVYTTFVMPFITWMMKSFFESLPIEAEEAALVDGYNRFQVFRLIALPQVLGSLFSVCLLAATMAWGEFLFALLYTNVQTQTSTVAVTTFWTDRQIFWGQIAGAGVLAALPMVIVGVAIQKYLIRGLTYGAMK